jgi:hypothetical protein
LQNHSHDHGTGLSREAQAILQRGLAEFLQITQGLEFRPIVSARFPLPLALAVYGETPDPERVRADVRARIETDPLSLLEVGLVLLELYACNQPGASASVPDNDAFLTQVFSSKRLNGWISFLGDAGVKEAQAALNARWQFKCMDAPEKCTGVYSMLNALARYAFVYGRVPFGDTHLLGHFIEDFTSGLVVCRGKLSDLESALSLAAMRIGVPAVTPPDYPFQLGRQVHAASRGGADIVCLQLLYKFTGGAYIAVYVCGPSRRLATRSRSRSKQGRRVEKPLTRRHMAATLSPRRGKIIPAFSPGEKVAEGRGRMRGFFRAFRGP